MDEKHECPVCRAREEEVKKALAEREAQTKREKIGAEKFGLFIFVLMIPITFGMVWGLWPGFEPTVLPSNLHWGLATVSVAMYAIGIYAAVYLSVRLSRAYSGKQPLFSGS